MCAYIHGVNPSQADDSLSPCWAQNTTVHTATIGAEAFEAVDGWEDAIWSSGGDDFSVNTVPITRWTRHVNAGYGIGRDALLG